MGASPAPALLEAGLVAVGHFCMREGAAAPRWFSSMAEAAAVYGGLGTGVAVRAQWESTMTALRAGAAPCMPERPSGLRAGWGSEHEAREAARRERELSKLAEVQLRLRAQLEQQRDAERTAWTEGGEAEGPSGAEWAARLRKAAGYEGAPASEVVGERDLGLADGVETSRGPRVIFDMQRDIASFGGEEGWMQRDNVDEDGWQEGWLQRAAATREGLMVDEAGYVAWRGTGVRLSAEEAAGRGPAVEMATRARLALGEEVEVEQGEPTKRQGGRGGGESKDGEEADGGGGTFVNVQAARASLVAMSEWCEKIGAQAVFTLDGTRTKVGGQDGAGGGGDGGGGGGRGRGGGRGGGSGGGGGGGGGSGDGDREERVCPICRIVDGAQKWMRCTNCEREVHTRCGPEEAEGFCHECTGATDEELFDWVNDLKGLYEAQATRREKEEAVERESAERRQRQEEEEAAAMDAAAAAAVAEGLTTAEASTEVAAVEVAAEVEAEEAGPAGAQGVGSEGGGGAEGGGFGCGVPETVDGGGDAEEAGGARLVAAWAAVRHDGARESGALPEGVRDNYMAEMAAQLAVAAKAGVKRVVIVFDATSPPEVLRRFVWSCRRKRQRIYRRDWLDTWWRQLQRFEAVVFLWQTSHVGAPVNEWADQAAAEAALAGLGERTPELLAVEYASLELEQADGQLIRGGPRATATAAAQLEVERRLAVGCGSVQMVEACDLDLPRLPDRLVTVAEAVMCGRAQIGDARRFSGRIALRMMAELGCPFGCGCSFAWHDVAFTCTGDPLVRLRAAWMEAAEEARRVLTARKPHSQWRRMQARGKEEGGKALKHGSAEEVELRRLVGGAVLRTGEGEVDGCTAVRAAVGRAVRAGLELQAAGRAATASFEWKVRKEVRRHAVARPYAIRWREVTRNGGPRRAAALGEAEIVRIEAEDALVRLEEDGWMQEGQLWRLGGLRALEHWATLGEMWKEIWARARSIRSISPACALREWRWLAGLRLWRWNVAYGGSAKRGVGGPDGHRRVPLPQDWDRVMQAVLGDFLRSKVTFGLEMILMDGRELDYRAYEARRRWVAGGGRRRLQWLRRWEVDEGREADKRGRWRVARVMDVRRPEGRHGRQLEVQVEWAGVDTLSGAAWSVEWVNIIWCTGDVRKEARRIEERRYPTARTAAGSMGSRKSPRLLEGSGGGPGGGSGGGEADSGGSEDEDEAGGGDVGGRQGEGGAGGGGAGGDGASGVGGRVRARGGTAADPIGAARAAAKAVARLDPTARHRRRRPPGVGEEDTTSEEEADEGGDDAGPAERDDLQELLHDVDGREGRREALFRRKDKEADVLMDNGVRINPYFRGRARQDSTGEREAAAEEGTGPRCQAGHGMRRRETDAAGLTCDGGCERALRRGSRWWCCDECDFDVCDACGGEEEDGDVED